MLIGSAGALFASWWLALLCMVLLALRYPAWEVLAIGFLIDLVWLPGGDGFSIPLFTLGAIVMVWIFAPLRARFLNS